MGKEAVGTDAARSLFNPTGKPIPPASAENNRLIREIGVLIQNKDNYEKAKKWIKKNYPDSPYQDPDRFLDHPPGTEALNNLLKELKS